MPKIRIKHMKMKDEPQIHIGIVRNGITFITVKTMINNVMINELIKITPKERSGAYAIFPISWIESENIHMNAHLHPYLSNIYKAVNGLPVGKTASISVNKKRIGYKDLGPVSRNRR